MNGPREPGKEMKHQRRLVAKWDDRRESHPAHNLRISRDDGNDRLLRK
jgi:hypothetical protein